ncbi:MAG: hypothetical protein SGILL_008759 [Bacillariaceae sp.]
MMMMMMVVLRVVTLLLTILYHAVGTHAYVSPHRPPVDNQVKVVFSDVDGALIHYPPTDVVDDVADGNNSNNDNAILALPPSATGMRGIVSSKTLRICRDLRQQRNGNTKLVLVSGMRTSTLLNRLPFLPRADAYCTEAGGRIFYPSPVEEKSDDENDDGNNNSQSLFPHYTPVAFEGSRPQDLLPFALREDLAWRERLEAPDAAGSDGYAGNEVFSNRCEGIDGDGDDEEECLIDYENPLGFPIQQEVVPVDQRKGTLWEFAKRLEQEGFVLDTKSYSTCFRVNRKHQTDGGDRFESLLQGNVVLPKGIEKSTNLGCIDFYPVSSGKRNCCLYLADELGIDIALQSVCVCDDDNDIEMAMACSQAYIPALTSDSMVATIRGNPTKFTQTYKEDKVTSTDATDAALQLIYERVMKAST